MRGKITNIDPEKPTSKSPGSRTFIRVYFELHDGDHHTQWAKTDLCPTFRNFMRWKHLLKIGNMIDGLTMKDPLTVDADSIPRLAEEAAIVPGPEPLPLPKPDPTSENIIVVYNLRNGDKLFLHIEHQGTPRENDVYYVSRGMATRFPNEQAVREATKRLKIDETKLTMKRPRKKAAP